MRALAIRRGGTVGGVRTALTRKNVLFAASDAGGERAAIAYTILGSCRLAGVDPREYPLGTVPLTEGSGLGFVAISSAPAPDTEHSCPMRSD